MEYKNDSANISTANHKHLAGIGGWLRFLIVSLTILAPLAILGRVTGEIQAAESQFPNLINLPLWNQMKEVSWTVGIVQAAILIGAGFLLWKTRLRSTTKRVITMLWIGGPLTAILGLLAIAYISNEPLATVVNHEVLGGILGSCISAFIWSAYLIRSRRVQNTYVQ
ncbi:MULTISPECIES: DUF2569 family protein [Comamonas]|uniref:DUF2569 family protein n=1 Tax=Comamonas TaxID=283 RepID=UPI00257D0E85|nr:MULTISPECIES: DUF2569 family protein [Comamonas]